MRKFSILTILMLCATFLFAQAPEKFTYQAVVRNANNTLVANAPVGVRVSILQGGVNGTLVYMETWTTVTNANGLITLQIGGGNVQQGNFADIDWSGGSYFLKTETDPDGGSNYTITSVQQLLSVPYALYAKDAGNAFSGDYNDLTNTPQIPTVPTNVSAFTNDANYITQADVPAQVNADWNATSGAAEILNKPVIPTVPTNVSAFTNDAGYITMDSIPAIPTIPTNVSAFTNDAGYITGYTETDPQFNAWDKDYNDLINKPAIPTVPTNVSAFTNDAGYITSAGIPTIPTVPTNVSAFTNDAGYITAAQVPAQVNADWNATTGAAQILNKPSLFSGNYNDLTNKPVLFSGNYNDLTNKPTLFDGNYNSLTNRPNLAAVALSGSYNDLINKPAIPTAVGELTNNVGYITAAQVPAQVNADWNATSGAAQILNKPTLFSGNYNDLTNKPTLFSGNYNDLTNLPQIPQIPADISAFNNDAGYLTSYTETDPQFNAWDKDYNDLINKPIIPTVPYNVSAFTNDAGYITAQNIPAIPTVPTNISAFSNDAGYITSYAETDPQFNAWNKDYNDLINKPIIPTVPSSVSAFINDAGYINIDSVPAIPTNVSAFTNDAGYLTSYTETDPNVPIWAKEATKPAYDYTEITNTPEIPTVPTNVSAFTNDAGYITSDDIPAIPTVPTNISAFTNDAGYLTSFTEQQVLSISHDTIFLSGGSFVVLPPAAVGFSGDYNDLTNKPTIPSIPQNISTFNNDAGYITAQDIPAIPTIPTNVSTFTNDAGYITSDTETDPQFNAWNKDYNDLINKPEIPTVPTNISVFNNDANYVTENQLNNANYITVDDIPVQVNADWDATTGTALILNKPTIPTTVSELTNDANYITINEIPDIPIVPENVSAFNNDAGYITTADIPEIPIVPENVSAFGNDVNYVSNTECPDVDLCALAAALTQLQALVEEQQQRIEELEAQISSNTTDTSTFPTDTTTFECHPFLSIHDTTVSQGSSVTLSVADTSMSSVTWTWTGNQSSGNTLFVSTNETTTYYATATNLGPELIVNGDFEQGNVGFSSEYNFTEEVTHPDGTYSIKHTGQEAKADWPAIPDHTTSSGLYLCANGDAHQKVLFSETVPVYPYLTYEFSLWFVSFNSSPQLMIKINNENVDVLATNTHQYQWEQAKFQWVNNDLTEITIQIVDIDTAPDGNDFGIDDISFRAVTGNNSCVDSVVVTVISSDTTEFPVDTTVTTMIPTGALLGLFSISDTTQVRFSQGNLQYQASSDTWRFADNQWDQIGAANSNISSSYSGWIDLFGWGTSGYDGKSPWMTSSSESDYGDNQNNIAYTYYDWGQYNPISNGGNLAGLWRTLSSHELNYLIYQRPNASNLYAMGLVNGRHGLIIFPDNFEVPNGISFTPAYKLWSNDVNNYSLNQWSLLEANGAVFLPVAGMRNGTTVSQKDESGYYWSTDILTPEEGAKEMWFGRMYIYYNPGIGGWASRHVGYSVRLVTDAGNSDIDTLGFAVDTSNASGMIHCSNIPTVTDIDGNIYNTVQIGNQCWMKENLRVTRFADSTEILIGVNSSIDVPYRYYPNNNSATVPTYGYLYNWSAVMHGASSSGTNPSGVQGICPTGWHVPSHAEWIELEDYLNSNAQYQCGGNEANNAKALASSTGWKTSSVNCAPGNNPSENNATAFSAVPGGCYWGPYGYFGFESIFWGATETSENMSNYYRIRYDKSIFQYYYDTKIHGYSVRCLKDNPNSSNPNPVDTTATVTPTIPSVTTIAVTNIFSIQATATGAVSSDGGSPVTARGVCWSTTQNPTISGSHTTDGSGTGSFSSSITELLPNTTYYLRAYATNSIGTAYGNQVQFTTASANPTPSNNMPCAEATTVTDYDGNVYNTIQMGNQCWTKENLRTTHFANGDAIDNGYHYIMSYEHPYGYFTGPDSGIYGFYYNGAAAIDSRNICPSGWHVPSDLEWTQLTNYIRSQNNFLCSENSNNIAKSMAGTIGWNESGTTCSPGYQQNYNNISGFSAIPAGRVYGTYENIGEVANFWTSTTESTATNGVYRVISRSISFNSPSVDSNNWYDYSAYKIDGKSVRCLRD